MWNGVAEEEADEEHQEPLEDLEVVHEDAGLHLLQGVRARDQEQREHHQRLFPLEKASATICRVQDGSNSTAPVIGRKYKGGGNLWKNMFYFSLR